MPESIDDSENIGRDRRTLINRIMDFTKSRPFGSCGCNMCYPVIHEIKDAIENDVKGHYLSLSQDDPEDMKISFASKPEFKFNNDKRTKTTLSRYLRRHLGVTSEQMNDDKLHRLSLFIFGAMINLRTPPKIVKGYGLLKAYKNAVGSDSCMTGDDCELVKLYAENPDKVNLIIAFKNQARALLWTTDKGTKILDRIYFGDPMAKYALQKWACEQNIVQRDNVHDSGLLVEFQSIKYIKKQYVVTLDSSQVDHYPYLDTFCWGRFEENNNVLKMSNEQRGFPLCFHCTDGSFEGRCNGCGEALGTVCINGENYCEDCVSDRFIYCYNCNDYADNESAMDVDGETYCESCGQELFFRCDGCGEYNSNDELHEVKREGYGHLEWCESCFAENGSHCEGCDWDFETDRGGFDEDGEFYCQDCGEQCEDCDEWCSKEGFDEHGHCSKCRESWAGCPVCDDFAKIDSDSSEGLCESCADLYGKCEVCGNFFKLETCEDQTEIYCDTCYVEHLSLKTSEKKNTAEKKVREKKSKSKTNMKKKRLATV